MRLLLGLRPTSAAPGNGPSCDDLKNGARSTSGPMLKNGTCCVKDSQNED